MTIGSVITICVPISVITSRRQQTLHVVVYVSRCTMGLFCMLNDVCHKEGCCSRSTVTSVLFGRELSHPTLILQYSDYGLDLTTIQNLSILLHGKEREIQAVRVRLVKVTNS